MKRICPYPKPWCEVIRRLNRHAKSHPCTLPTPPKPLILGGWVYSNNLEKLERWEETLDWAARNGCAHLTADIPEADFHCALEPTSYTVGPLGGPMYLAWDFTAKNRPSPDEISKLMEILSSRWTEIVGEELAGSTRPFELSGKKARRLVVIADASQEPPWGGWAYRSTNETKRRTFTQFRAAINEAVAPHEIDHVDFTVRSSP